jgi:hypothetical protein
MKEFLLERHYRIRGGDTIDSRKTSFCGEGSKGLIEAGNRPREPLFDELGKAMDYVYIENYRKRGMVWELDEEDEMAFERRWAAVKCGGSVT